MDSINSVNSTQQTQPGAVDEMNKDVKKNSQGESGIEGHADGARTLTRLSAVQFREIPEKAKARAEGMKVSEKLVEIANRKAAENIDGEAAKKLKSAIDGAKDIAGKNGISKEAKAVYECLEKILTGAKTEDFSSENIGKILRSIIEKPANLEYFGGTGTVGMYKARVDGEEWKPNQAKSITGYPSPDASKHGGALVCINRARAAGIEPKFKEEIEINPQNVGVSFTRQVETGKTDSNGEAIKEEVFNAKSTKNELGLDTYKFNTSSGKEVIYTCEDGFHPEQYTKQLNRDAASFSGNVNIHKLEPGTVLVRVFGQGQTVKAGCLV